MIKVPVQLGLSISSIFLFSRNTKMMRNRNCFAEFRLFREIKKRRNFVSPCFAKLKFSRFRKYFRKKDNFVHIFAHKKCYMFSIVARFCILYGLAWLPGSACHIVEHGCQVLHVIWLAWLPGSACHMVMHGCQVLHVICLA